MTYASPKPGGTADTVAQSDKYGTREFARAQEVASARLYPSIFASNYLVLSNRRVRMEKFFAARREIGDVLDVGGQYCPYYPLFREKCRSYSSLDIVDTPIVDIVCNAEDMPMDDRSFDLVLCTQVLEHCTNPHLIVNECHRVLREGGTLIVTAPSVYPVHGYPADNWRFMPDGMRHLLREFSRVEVLGELDFAESLASVICHYGHVVTGRLGMAGRAVNPVWHFSTNVAGRALSLALRPLSKNNFDAFSMNLWAEATK
jgi:SAM-dependent methyltransferase